MALFRCGGNGAFDISTVPAGSCAHAYSSGGTAGYGVTAITGENEVVITPTSAATGDSVLVLVNATGYANFSIKGNTACIAFGLNDDGTLTPIYAAVISSGTIAHVISTQGYKYILCSTVVTGGTSTRARLY